jgi:hypothetical protein
MRRALMYLNLYGCEAVRHKGKNSLKTQILHFLPVFALMLDSHIGWDKSMPFASINPTNPRTNPWNFHKQILRIGDFEKCTFFESAILNFFFQKKKFFFAFFQWKLVKVYWLARMAQNFDQAKRDNTFWPTPNILGGSVQSRGWCIKFAK